jgi:hypothetical protein
MNKKGAAKDTDTKKEKVQHGKKHETVPHKDISSDAPKQPKVTDIKEKENLKTHNRPTKHTDPKEEHKDTKIHSKVSTNVGSTDPTHKKEEEEQIDKPIPEKENHEEETKSDTKPETAQEKLKHFDISKLVKTKGGELDKKVPINREYEELRVKAAEEFLATFDTNLLLRNKDGSVNHKNKVNVEYEEARHLVAKKKFTEFDKSKLVYTKSGELDARHSSNREYSQLLEEFGEKPKKK